jgi:hypothetical protein
MAVIFPDVLKDPFIFNSDRNTWMSGGGTHTWSGTYNWAFTDPIYINWLAGRGLSNATRRGTANYNVVAATTVNIPIDSVAYVTLDPNTDGAALAVTVCAGTALPQGDNVFVLAMHRDLGLSPNNPLLMRWGNAIPVGGSYNATSGFPTFGYANNYAGATWTVNHLLNSTDCVVLCQDNASPRNQIFPQSVAFTNVNTITITFSTSVTGRAVVLKAG